MKSYKDYMLFDKLPQTWCAGCSHGFVLQSIAAVMAELEVDNALTWPLSAGLAALAVLMTTWTSTACT